MQKSTIRGSQIRGYKEFCPLGYNVVFQLTRRLCVLEGVALQYIHC
jgi:hypothetical protein